MFSLANGNGRLYYAPLLCTLLFLTSFASANAPALSARVSAGPRSIETYDLSRGLPVGLRIIHEGEREKHFVSYIEVYVNNSLSQTLVLAEQDSFRVSLPADSLVSFKAICNIHGPGEAFLFKTTSYRTDSRRIPVTVTVTKPSSISDSFRDIEPPERAALKTTTTLPAHIQEDTGSTRLIPIWAAAAILLLIILAIRGRRPKP